MNEQELLRKIEPKKTYVVGLGITEVGSGLYNLTKTPFLLIGDLKEQTFKIGELIPNEHIDENSTVVFFKNLDGLKVFENQIKRIKKILKNQK